MRRARWFEILAAAAGLLAATAGAGHGRVLLQEDFRNPVPGMKGGEIVQSAQGRGWRGAGGCSETVSDRVEYDLGALGLRPEQGTIEVELTRDERAPTEAPFSLADAQGNRLFVFRLEWLGAELEDANRPMVMFWGGPGEKVWFTPEKDDHGNPYLMPGAFLPKMVRAGQRARFALTWGSGGIRLYLDGKPLGGAADGGYDLGARIKAASKLIVGAETSSTIPRGAWSMTASMVHSIRVFDVALTAEELGGATYFESVAAEKVAYRGGEEIIVTLRGSADRTATFSVAGVGQAVPMQEVDDGVYVGKVAAPTGVNVASAALTAALTDPSTGKGASAGGRPISIDGEPPTAVPRIIAGAPWGGELLISWEASPSADLDHYLVFRGEGRKPYLLSDPYVTVKGLEFTDTRVVPGIEYHYVVVPVDRAGNRGPESADAWAAAIAGEGPKISAFAIDPVGRPAKPGQVVAIDVSGQSGGQLLVDVGALASGVALTEEGRTGRYVGSYVVKDADVGATKGVHRLVAKLTDAFGTSTLAGPELVVVGLDTINDKTPPVVTRVTQDGFKVAGISGKLVAGDVVTVTLEGEPAGYASFDVAGVVRTVPMKETQPGVYWGSFTVPWGAAGTAVTVTGHLADEAGNESSLGADAGLTFDTRVRLAVTAQDGLLPADRKSQTRLSAKAVDANGKKVEGHELALTLSTTEEYTGVVGGGAVGGRLARMEDEDNVEVKWGGTTDSFGEVTAAYTAGFAAKTALIVAKDLTTGDVGAGWLNTYVASTVAIELVPRTPRGAVDRAVLRISADPPWVTADGRSTSRVRVMLTDLTGAPLAGQRVAFSLGNENGRIKVLRNVTDSKGLAEVEYRAGTVAGFVTLTATAAELGVAGAVQIELRADAPAKIELVASAAKLVADGSSKAKLSFRVSDIHDNPNIKAPVSFAILQGAGTLSDVQLLTDRFGEGQLTFTAGTRAGTAIVEARHTSRAPTEDELRRVYGTVFVPRFFQRQERDRVKVAEWLVKPGEKVNKGDSVVVLETKTGMKTLEAPAKGVFVRQVKFEGDTVDLGDTLGYTEIDPDVWKAEYVK